jgi:tetrahydromethanopterin S-methyltransferase subunit H
MYQVNGDPKVVAFNDVKLGGFPGEYPTVLIGSIFYAGHKIVKDKDSGDFDREAAELLITKQDEMSDLTGNPCMIDVVGSTSEALVKEVEFVSTMTSAPLLVDGVVPKVRVDAIKQLTEIGLRDRIIYNSLIPDFEAIEIETLRECGITSALLLAFNQQNLVTSGGRIEAISGKEGQTGLLGKVEEAGIRKVLIDTMVLDLPSLALASKALMQLRKKFGYPVGCGAHNAVATWKGLKKKMPREAVNPCGSFANALPIIYGADFIIYGPIKDCTHVFPVCAMADVITAFTAMEDGIKPKVSTHPMRKIT